VQLPTLRRASASRSALHRALSVFTESSAARDGHMDEQRAALLGRERPNPNASKREGLHAERPAWRCEKSALHADCAEQWGRPGFQAAQRTHCANQRAGWVPIGSVHPLRRPATGVRFESRFAHLLRELRRDALLRLLHRPSAAERDTHRLLHIPLRSFCATSAAGCSPSSQRNRCASPPRFDFSAAASGARSARIFCAA